MSEVSADVVIVGGGHAGLWLALAVSRAGLRAFVVEPDSPEQAMKIEPDGRTLALLGGSRAVGERQGVWSAIGGGEPVREVEVVDAATGARVAYHGRAVPGGVLAWGIENRQLRAALARTFVQTNGTRAWIEGRLSALRRSGRAITAILADGRELTTRLLVGADGRGSRVRNLLQIGVNRLKYEQAALAFVVAHTGSHGAMVRERLRAGGPLALLPLTGSRCGVTWVEPEPVARQIAGLSPPEVLARLDVQIAGVLGSLSLASPVAVWPLGAQHARRYVASRSALVGDAAHGVHPIHAQGLNMGIADVGALVDQVLAAHRRGQDIGAPDVLLAYERARWWDNERRLRLTDGLNRLFSNELVPARLLRGAILRAVETLPPLKSLAVHEGMRAG